eukprot:NODE_1092_length_1285_cov_131.114887_g896_i0.p1 GENE.NODE_1092_length_1285_cov_131.114887_g896_i0~~NODE_1092_length_1285_cov_131.114887_g896_i0.p1  ORF type:complete len:384 (+),score=128.15 NODE_1092_length_1285_cov_131.114887_g896_i0:171-1154(+)
MGVILSEMVLMKLMREDWFKQRPVSMDQQGYQQLMHEAGQARGGKFLGLLKQLLEHEPGRRLSAQDARHILHEVMKSHGDKPTEAHLQFARQAGISAEECADCFRSFKLADVNGDGSISTSELQPILTMLGVNVSAASMMRRLDRDGSGSLEFPEFLTWWSGRNKKWVAQTSADQELGEDILKGLYMTSAEYNKMRTSFKQMDSDRMGKISVAAFYYLISNTMGVAVPWEQFTLTVGPGWSDKTVLFDEVLSWWKHNVDGQSKKFRAMWNRVFRVGDNVEVKRSDGSWTPSQVSQVTKDGYLCMYADGSGNKKEIQFNQVSEYLRCH